MSIFILVVNEGELSLPGNNQRCSNYGCNTRHGPFNTYAKYRCSKLGHGVVMNIWNIDAWQRQNSLTPAVSCYFMSLSDKVSYLLDSIMLLSQIIATMISTVKFERNNLPFTIGDILKGELNWSMYEITRPCYVINICILYQLCFKQNDFLQEELIGYTHANFHQATTFGCQNIAFQIWWLPCNPHRSEWPKTFFGRCIAIFNQTIFIIILNMLVLANITISNQTIFIYFGKTLNEWVISFLVIHSGVLVSISGTSCLIHNRPVLVFVVSWPFHLRVPIHILCSMFWCVQWEW